MSDLARKETMGYALATYNKNKITEIRAADQDHDRLTPNDVHFGINCSANRPISPADFGTLKDDLGLTSEPNACGPRILDVLKRGGTIAEVLWEKWQADPGVLNVSGFLTFFEEFNRSPISTHRAADSSTHSNRSVEQKTKYDPFSKDKGGSLDLKGGISQGVEEHYLGNLEQFGARWSKTALEMVIQRKFGDGTGRIHFHLDGMGDVFNIVNKEGGFTHNVTSRELRYLRRNWSRLDVRMKVVFYNGYTGFPRHAVIVKCPWG